MSAAPNPERRRGASPIFCLRSQQRGADTPAVPLALALASARGKAAALRTIRWICPNLAQRGGASFCYHEAKLTPQS